MASPRGSRSSKLTGEDPGFSEIEMEKIIERLVVSSSNTAPTLLETAKPRPSYEHINFDKPRVDLRELGRYFPVPGSLRP